MHQTVHTFFSRPEGLVAKSVKFNMSEEDARRRISITCFRYLMLCIARSALEDGPPNTKCWEPAHFEKYAEHLNRRPLIDYALSHFQQHQNDCALRLQKRKNDCSQCINDERLIFQLSEQLSNNPASLLLESWTHSYLGLGIAGKEKGQSLKGFRKNMQHTAKSAHVRFKSWIDSCRGKGVAAKEKMPFSKDFRNNMLHTATRMQYSHLVESLLTAGTDKDACLFHKTPLIISAEAGDVATAGVLLRRKACTDAKDNFERTALLLAAMKGYDTIVSLLINSGAKKDATDQYGQTALHLATSKGYNSIVQLLVENLGADTEVQDNGGSTSLHVAVIWNQGSTVQLLLTFGANIEAEDNRKRTALHWAAIYGCKEIIKLLLNDFGANSEAENWQKQTALHYAALYRHESTVQLLVNTFHVNLEAKDQYGRTPRDLSQER